MRVSALRITKPQAPPQPDLWEGFEDIRNITLRHGRLYTETEVSPKGAIYGHNAEYQLLQEKHHRQHLEQQQAKNKARALAQYEWRKPENAAARAAKARAAYAAQKAQQEAAHNALREQLVASEAARILREDEEERAREMAALLKAARTKAQKEAERTRLDGERQAAIAWWTQMNKSYAHEHYHPCRFADTMWVGEVKLEAGKGYWLPGTVRLLLFKQLGLR